MRRPFSRATAAALALSLALPLAATIGTAGPSFAAGGCSVKNTATGATTTSLKVAVKRARAGATLQVSGTCAGPISVSRKLTVSGRGRGATIKGGSPVLAVAAGAKVRVTGLTITGGKAPDCVEWASYVCGGGVVNHGTLTLDRVTVAGNTATGDADRTDAYAAGIYNAWDGTLVMTRSTVRGNHTEATAAGWGQGGGIGNDGTLTIRGSTISGNTTAGGVASQGAGIHSEGYNTDSGKEATGSLTIEDSTLSGNSAGGEHGAGGALYNDAYAVKTELTFVTISGNSARQGGGLAMHSKPVLVSTLIAGNTDVIGNPDCWSTPAIDADRSLIRILDGCTLTGAGDFNLTGTTGSPQEAGIGPLKANGGPTRTHALLADSPAIDKGGPSPCALARDQRGVARPRGSACDIGAFEKG